MCSFPGISCICRRERASGGTGSMALVSFAVFDSAMSAIRLRDDLLLHRKEPFLVPQSPFREMIILSRLSVCGAEWLSRKAVFAPTPLLAPKLLLPATIHWLRVSVDSLAAPVLSPRCGRTTARSRCALRKIRSQLEYFFKAVNSLWNALDDQQPPKSAWKWPATTSRVAFRASLI